MKVRDDSDSTVPSEAIVPLRHYTDDDVRAANRAAAQLARQHAQRRAGAYRIAFRPRPTVFVFGLLVERIADRRDRWCTVVPATGVAAAMSRGIDLMQDLLDFGAPRFDAPEGGLAEYEVTNVVRLTRADHPDAIPTARAFYRRAGACGFKPFDHGNDVPETPGPEVA